MIKAMAQGFTDIAKKPAIIVPSLIVAFVNTIVLALFSDSYFNFIYETLVFGEVPETSLINIPYYMLSVYGADIFLIVVSAAISIVAAIYAMFVYSALATDPQKGVGKALGEGLQRLPEMLWLTIFILTALFLYFALGLGLLAISSSAELGLFMLALMLLWGLGGLCAYLKLMFAPVVMALERQKVKQALSQSWKWSEKKCPKLFAFLFLLTLITAIVTGLFSGIADAIAIDLIGIIILTIGIGVSGAYFNIAVIRYYLGSK